MANYCKKCKEVISGTTLCRHQRALLAADPQLLVRAADFVVVAGQHHLITSQSLNVVAEQVNKLAGTNLAHEGTHQLIRDMQVFRQLNVDGFCKSGHFSSAQRAQAYIQGANENSVKSLGAKLAGAGQEIDWLRQKQGQISSVLWKSKLLGEELTNTPGVDGITINRLTGEQISRTTIKASQNVKKSLGTNIGDLIEALRKGTLDPTDEIVGVQSTSEKFQKALAKNILKAEQAGDVQFAERLKAAQAMKVQELGTDADVRSSVERLKGKMTTGQATSTVTLAEVGRQAANGAVIGAVVALSVSSLTAYLQYRDGEISAEEAFENISRETAKGAMVGAGVAVASLFLPAGAMGFVAGVAVGIYLNAVVSNVLDEIYGRGAYGAILDASGYTYGTTVTIVACIHKIQADQRRIAQLVRHQHNLKVSTKSKLDEFDSILNGEI